MNDSHAAFHVRFGGVSPSSVCSTAQKQGRSSKSSFLVMAHLPVPGESGEGAAAYQIGCPSAKRRAPRRIVNSRVYQEACVFASVRASVRPAGVRTTRGATRASSGLRAKGVRASRQAWERERR